MKKKLKILITGPVPPPAGGISIHIERLTHLLKDEFDIDLIDESGLTKKDIFNMRSFNFFAYLKKVKQADILFIHSGNKLFKKLHILTGRLFAKKVVITIHGYGNRRKQPFRSIDGFIYSMPHKIILVNNTISGKLSLPAQKCVVKHAFLPPLMQTEPALLPAVAERIQQARNNNKVIICANASRLGLHNNQDLYGLDMCIEVTKRFIQKGLPVSFIYTVSALESGAELFNKNKALIAELGLEDHFMLISEKLSFVRLIENADIVVRPTNTDGDALTIREALFLGKPTLASDIVERPEGTLLFKTRDMADFEIKLEEQVKIVKQHPRSSFETSNAPLGDFKSFYIDLLNSVALT